MRPKGKHTFQFVAMPLGQGYTIEEQLTGQTKHGGIQIDVFPTFNSAVTFTDGNGPPLDLTLSPLELGIASGNLINMQVKCVAILNLQAVRDILD
jgi:hypothetical protein